MKKYIFLISIVILGFKCSSQSVDSTDITKPDTSTYTFIQYNEKSHFWLFKDAKPFDISAEELVHINKILTKWIQEKNKKEEEIYNNIKTRYPEYKRPKESIINLNDYKKQYIAVINANQEKEVWINCFREAPSNWRSELVIVKNEGHRETISMKIKLKSEHVYNIIM